MKQITAIIFSLLVLVSGAWADTRLVGQVIDDETRKPLEGVNVVLVGTEMGAATNTDGFYTIRAVEAGTYKIRASYIGYARVTRAVEVSGDEIRVNFALEPSALVAPQVIVEPTRAVDRQTPMTFSNISEEELEYRDQIQDIPLMLSDLPSTKTYSETGTGIGYSYLNIRGFDQRRISVLINGVPQNDPEDHNVYWIDFYDLVGSLKDIQVQRGAGTAFYGPASIGGSVNLITQNYSRESTLQFESMYGSYNTRKASLEGSTGLLGNHWIGYGRLTRITTDNYRDWSWMEFWRYFAGVGYFSKDHILKIQTYGGPQEDGLAYYGIPKDYVSDPEKRTINYSSATRDVEWFNQPHYELLHQWQLSENLTMNNTFYYIRGYGYFDYDGSWAPPSYFRLPVNQFAPAAWYPEDGPVDVASNTMIRAYVDNNQGGLLHKYTWDHERGELTAGISIRGHSSLHWGRIQESDGLVFTDTVTAETQTVS
ncbi:MAG TPA: TonB-dependent receptor, partial [bacterium]|nr:TonB-dependent receptor [bacterium]